MLSAATAFMLTVDITKIFHSPKNSSVLDLQEVEKSFYNSYWHLFQHVHSVLPQRTSSFTSEDIVSEFPPLLERTLFKDVDKFEENTLTYIFLW